MTYELLFVSLVVLLLVLMVLLVLCWTLRRSKSRNFTELQITAGRPTRILTIRTEPDHAHQLLGHLLDRVFLQGETEPESGAFGGERESDSGSDPEALTSASLPSGAANTFQDKLWKWITVARPSPATPLPSPPPPPPTDMDQNNDLGPQRSDTTQHASFFSQEACCSSSCEVEQHDESDNSKEK